MVARTSDLEFRREVPDGTAPRWQRLEDDQVTDALHAYLGVNGHTVDAWVPQQRRALLKAVEETLASGVYHLPLLRGSGGRLLRQIDIPRRDAAIDRAFEEFVRVHALPCPELDVTALLDAAARPLNRFWKPSPLSPRK